MEYMIDFFWGELTAVIGVDEAVKLLSHKTKKGQGR